jgi:hypothetical protein
MTKPLMQHAHTISTTTPPTLTCEWRWVPQQKSRRFPPASRSYMNVPKYASAASRFQSIVCESVSPKGTGSWTINYHPQSGWFEDTPLKGGTEEGCPLKGVHEGTFLIEARQPAWNHSRASGLTVVLPLGLLCGVGSGTPPQDVLSSHSTPERQSLFESHRQRRWLTRWSYVVVCDERGLVVGHEQLTTSVPLSVTFALTIPTGRPPPELTASAPQHRWGRSLLNPLPHILNAATTSTLACMGWNNVGRREL